VVQFEATGNPPNEKVMFALGVNPVPLAEMLLLSGANVGESTKVCAVGGGGVGRDTEAWAACPTAPPASTTKGERTKIRRRNETVSRAPSFPRTVEEPHGEEVGEMAYGAWAAFSLFMGNRGGSRAPALEDCDRVTVPAPVPDQRTARDILPGVWVGSVTWHASPLESSISSRRGSTGTAAAPRGEPAVPLGHRRERPFDLVMTIQHGVGHGQGQGGAEPPESVLP
jgi:hypothetical protein